jgi:hypothetical protein
MNLVKDLWAHLKEWSDWKMKDWIKAAIVAVIVIADGVKGFVETKKAKAELKVTEVKAATKLKQDQIAGKVAWEQSAVDQMKGSWKDELILICLLAPATLVFFPGMTEHIEKGFIALIIISTFYT